MDRKPVVSNFAFGLVVKSLMIGSVAFASTTDFGPIDKSKFPELYSQQNLQNAKRLIPKAQRDDQKALDTAARCELAHTYQNKAGELFSKKDFNGALKAYSKARILRPDVDGYIQSQIECLLQMGQAQEANKLLDTNRPHSNLVFMENKIKILTALRRYDEALDWCNKLIVGSLDGKPYHQNSFKFRYVSSEPFVLEAKIFAAQKKMSQAHEKAQSLFYFDSIRSNTQSKQSLALTQELNIAPLKRTVNKEQNYVALNAVKNLMGKSASKVEFERIFGRAFFVVSAEGTGYDSSDGSSVFPDVYFEQESPGKGVLNIKFNPMNTYITKEDVWEMFGLTASEDDKAILTPNGKRIGNQTIYFGFEDSKPSSYARIIWH